MSPRDRTESVAVLRAAIARIEGDETVAAGLGRVAPRQEHVRLGPAGFGLDRVLGGGLRRGGLHEIVPAGARDEAAASGFALALAARCLADRSGVLVWIVEDGAGRESGLPYGPGLGAYGIDPGHLVMVRTGGSDATLWAAEEALRTRHVVVLAELWGGRSYGLAPSRRLVLAARAAGAVGLLLHAGLPGSSTVSSGGEARFRVGATLSPSRPAVGRRLPVPGHPAFAVRLDKVRAAACAFDPQETLTLLWNAEQRCFHDHAHPLAVAPALADRPAGRQGGRASR